MTYKYIIIMGGGGGSVTLCDKGGRGVKIGQKKRYVIVERPLRPDSIAATHGCDTCTNNAGLAFDDYIKLQQKIGNQIFEITPK